MPDLRGLYNYLGRVQKSLQSAMDEGDEQKTSYNEALMERGQQLAQRWQQEGVMTPSPAVPATAFNATTPQEKPQALGAPPSPAGSTQPQQQPTQSPPMPPQAAPSVQAPFDVSKINQADKINIDLNQEIKSPFGPSNPNQYDWKSSLTQPTKPNAIQGAMNTYGATPPSSPVSSSASSGKESQGLFSKVGEAYGTVAKPVWDWLNTPITPPTFGDVKGKPGVTAPGYVPGTGEAGIKQPAITPEVPVPGSTLGEMNAAEADTSGRLDVSKQYGKYKDMDTAWLVANTKQKAKDPFEMEFLNRVERELGRKPQFFTLENLAMLLLMGAPRAYQNFKSQEQWYNQGKRDIGKELRHEAVAKAGQNYRQEKDRLDREIQLQKISAQFLPDAIKATVAPMFKEVDRLGARLTALTSNPATDPNSPEIKQLMNQIQALTAQAQAVTDASMPKGVIKRPTIQE